MVERRVTPSTNDLIIQVLLRMDQMVLNDSLVGYVRRHVLDHISNAMLVVAQFPHQMVNDKEHEIPNCNRLIDYVIFLECLVCDLWNNNEERYLPAFDVFLGYMHAIRNVYKEG